MELILGEFAAEIFDKAGTIRIRPSGLEMDLADGAILSPRVAWWLVEAITKYIPNSNQGAFTPERLLSG